MAESTTTRKTKAKATDGESVDWKAKYEEFQRQTREEAVRVAARQGWCDTGLNETLRNLGLPEKREFVVPVKIVTEQTTNITVTDAMSMEDAVAMVAAGKWNGDTTPESFTRGYWGNSVTYVSHAVPTRRGVTECEVGDMDPTGEEREEFRNLSDPVERRTRNTCDQGHSREDDGGGYYYCTRPRNHDADRHVGGGESIVRDVWDVTTESPVHVTSTYWETLDEATRDSGFYRTY